MPPASVETGRVRELGYRLLCTPLGRPEKGTLLVLHGGPGFDKLYLLSLFDLAPHGLRVVLYDQLGNTMFRSLPKLGRVLVINVPLCGRRVLARRSEFDRSHCSHRYPSDPSVP